MIFQSTNPSPPPRILVRPSPLHEGADRRTPWSRKPVGHHCNREQDLKRPGILTIASRDDSQVTPRSTLSSLEGSGKSPEPWMTAPTRVLGSGAYYALHWIRWLTELAPGAFMSPCLIAAMEESKLLRVIDPLFRRGPSPDSLEYPIDVSR